MLLNMPVQVFYFNIHLLYSQLLSSSSWGKRPREMPYTTFTVITSLSGYFGICAHYSVLCLFCCFIKFRPKFYKRL